MLISAYAPRIIPGDPVSNIPAFADAMEDAAEAGARLLLTPELSLCGVDCGSLYAHAFLQEKCAGALAALLRESRRFPDLVTVVGLPVRFRGELYSAAAVLCGGELLGYAPLCSRLPFFAPPGTEKGILVLPGLPEAAFSSALGVPLPELTAGFLPGAALRLCPSAEGADAFSADRLARRTVALAGDHAALLCCPGAGESTTDRVYTGFCAAGTGGGLLGISDYELLVCDLSDTPSPLPEPSVCSPRTPFLPYDAEDTALRCRRILHLQSSALATRMERSYSKKCVVGVSGGLDSTLALLVSAEALRRLSLPAENLIAVTMPGYGTTGRTRSNAEIISLRLGADFREIPIGESVALHFRDIGHDPALRNSTYENAQARERTQVLMDLANDGGGLVIGTGDLSELALGWCTYNGDHMSMYAVNAGLPKTVIRAVVAQYAADCGDAELAGALRDILATPISPELLPPDGETILQVTEDLVGPYELHDFFLYRFLVLGEAPRAIFKAAADVFDGVYDAETVKKWLAAFLRRFFSQQFKRSCAPDGPDVLGVSLSPRCGFRMASDLSSGAWLRELEDI